MKLPARTRWEGLAAASALTGYAFAVEGYHPFAEDGGVYAAGVRKLLDPALYPAYTAFVTEHLRFSLFAPAVALCVRVTGLSLEWVLLLGHLFALSLTLYAGWMLAARMAGRRSDRRSARLGAVSVLAGALSIPLAGTSLYLTDPYLTARSLTTPLSLLALAWALDAMQRTPQRTGIAWLKCTGALATAALLHPLMAGYALAAVVVLVVTGARQEPIRRHGPWLLAGAALLLAGVVQATGPPESAAYLEIVRSRFYWFPFLWHGYEQVGLVGPLLVIAALARALGGPWHNPLQPLDDTRAAYTLKLLTRTTLILAGISLLVAAVFARIGLQTHAVARLQPLRCFGLVYAMLLLTAGLWLGERVLRRRAWRWALLLTSLGVGMATVQRTVYAHSGQIEWPGHAPRNGWEQAFVWIRQNTPTDAVFALDAHYITEGRHEEAQCFRAVAARSALPDYSKDGGEASITPILTRTWALDVAAQTGLDRESDSARIAALRGTGANWAVLERTSATAWPCPYRNREVQVCRIPR